MNQFKVGPVAASKVVDGQGREVLPLGVESTTRPEYGLNAEQLLTLNTANAINYVKVIELRKVPHTQPKDKLLSSRSVVAMIREEFKDLDREHLAAVYVDAKHKPVAYNLISIGTATSSLVDSAMVFKPAIMLNACALILIHNHPSGDTKPSPEDIAITKRIKEAGELIGIDLLDHIIVGPDCTGYRSFLDLRLPPF